MPTNEEQNTVKNEGIKKKFYCEITRILRRYTQLAAQHCDESVVVTMAPLQVWFAWQIVPPIPAQVFDITTVPPATGVGVTAFCAGVVAYDGIMQVPAQHLDESVVLIRSPEQVSSARQMWPPVSAQVSATDATAVCCVGTTETTAPACVVCAAPTWVAVGTAVSPADVCAASRVAVGTAVSPADVCAASRVAVGTGSLPVLPV